MQQRKQSAPQPRSKVYGALNPRYDVRNIMSRSAQTIRGRMACGKAQGEAKIESWWESMFCLRAEANGDLLWFETHPCRFEFEIAGQPSKYTPDAAVGHRQYGTCLIEVKRQADIARPDTLVRLTGIRRHVEPLGFRLLYSTDRELRRPEENARIRVVKIQRCMYTMRETESFAGRLAGYQMLTIGEATAILGRRNAVLHLLAKQHFFVDYRHPLTSNAIIARNPLEASHAVTLFSPW